MQTTLTPDNIHNAIAELRKREGRAPIDDSHTTYDLQAVPFYEAPIDVKGLIHKKIEGGGLAVGRRCGKCELPEKPCVCYVNPQPVHWVKLPPGWITT